MAEVIIYGATKAKSLKPGEKYSVEKSVAEKLIKKGEATDKPLKETKEVKE